MNTVVEHYLFSQDQWDSYDDTAQVCYGDNTDKGNTFMCLVYVPAPILLKD